MATSFPYYQQNKDLPWDTLQAEHQWFAALFNIPLDEEEDDSPSLGVYTKVCYAQLLEAKFFKDLSFEKQEFWVAVVLLHALAKCRKDVREVIEGEEFIVSVVDIQGAERTARNLIYTLGQWDFQEREAAIGMIALHDLPLEAIVLDDARKAVIDASCRVNTEELAQLARLCIASNPFLDREVAALNIDLFEELCKENECWGETKAFKSNYGRFLYLSREDYSPDYEPYEDLGFTVTMICGMPSNQRAAYNKEHLNLSSVVMSEIRMNQKSSPYDKEREGKSIQIAKDRMQPFLQQRKSFVFSGTFVSKELRRPWLKLFLQHKARVRIIYVETSYRELCNQNEENEQAVHPDALHYMITKLDIPSFDEGHDVEYVIC